jgi:hypothetical protein
VASILFGVGTGRDGTLSPWGTLPLAVGALAGLISFAADIDYLGTALWILFGIGWAWLGLSLVVTGIASLATEKRPSPTTTPTNNRVRG